MYLYTDCTQAQTELIRPSLLQIDSNYAGSEPETLIEAVSRFCASPRDRPVVGHPKRNTSLRSGRCKFIVEVANALLEQTIC